MHYYPLSSSPVPTEIRFEIRFALKLPDPPQRVVCECHSVVF